MKTTRTIITKYGFYARLIEDLASSEMQDRIVNKATVKIYTKEEGEECYYVLEVTEP